MKEQHFFTGLNFVVLLAVSHYFAAIGDTLASAINYAMIAVMVVGFVPTLGFFAQKEKKFAMPLTTSSASLFALAVLYMTTGIMSFHIVYAIFAFIALIVAAIGLNKTEVQAKIFFLPLVALLAEFSFFPLIGSPGLAQAWTFLIFIIVCAGLIMVIAYTPKKVDYYTYQ